MKGRLFEIRESNWNTDKRQDVTSYFIICIMDKIKSRENTAYIGKEKDGTIHIVYPHNIIKEVSDWPKNK